MRQSPNGIYIYGDEGAREVQLNDGEASPSAEIDELYDALVNGKPMLHNGRWGLATLEVCLAIMQSSRQHRDVTVTHQVPVPTGV